MIFGIMGAMPDEVDQLCAKLENVTVEPYGGVDYHKGTLAGKQVVVCCAGMGKANAAATTQVLITKFGAEKIIFSGIAGNMTSKIGIGDVVIGKTVLYHDAQLDMICQNPPFLKEYTGDPELIAAAEKACAKAGVKALVGKIATGDLFVGDSETKAAIEAKCAPDCVEMEGAAVSQIAAKNGVPCVILRAMSDNADEDGHEVLVVKKFSIAEYVATAVCSVGIDMVIIPGDTTPAVISALIADEAAIGMVNSKTTAVRVIPAIGRKAGEVLDFGGLLGYGPIMPVNQRDPSVFINRGGRLPAPMQSLKN